ncbi:MAG: hypothetical protein EOO07_17205 [Chitinophagaceae bacterium]|nr:MAG: hypothetical protein EOO07_17205 [Chitinophagaceae bacterium]
MKTKLLFVILLMAAFVGVNIAKAQSIWTNAINSSTAGGDPALDNPYTAGDVVVSNLAVSGIGLGPGLTINAVTDRYSARAWQLNSTAIDTDEYFSFTLTPSAGYKINFVSLSLNHVHSANAPDTYVLRSSVDNYSTNIATGNFGTSNTANVLSLADATLQGITNAVTFRLYYYGSSSTAVTGGVSIYNFTFNGSVVSTTLPVTFTQISANKMGSNINVNWTTASETNNDHFEIEASTDGKAFKNIKTVATKNGNSSEIQAYQETVALTDIAGVLAFPFLLAFVGFSSFSRRQKVVLSLLGLIAIGSSFVACQKEGNDFASEKEQISKDIISGQKTVYIRIKQVDKNGEFSYSDVVVAK